MGNTQATRSTVQRHRDATIVSLLVGLRNAQAGMWDSVTDGIRVAEMAASAAFQAGDHDRYHRLHEIMESLGRIEGHVQELILDVEELS